MKLFSYQIVKEQGDLLDVQDDLGNSALHLAALGAHIGLFCESQSPHKSVNLFFILVIIKDKLTVLWGD